MKKLILYVIIAFISLIPTLKVNASTSTNSDVYMDSNVNKVMEWIYNTSNDYLMNLVSEYDYKLINVKRNDIRENNGVLTYYYWVYVIGSNTQQKLYNRWRQGYASGFFFRQPAEVYYQILVHTSDHISYYDNNNNFLNSINSYFNLESNYSHSIDLTEEGGGLTYIDQNMTYSIYYNTFTLGSNSGTNRSYTLYDLNNNLVGSYAIGDVIPSYIVLYHGIPNYLEGYEKIGLSPSVGSVVISNVTKGSIYIPVDDFNKCYGIFGYFDKEKDFQTYDSIIENYTITDDGKYVKQDFDLDNYAGADYVFYQKCQYVTGEDDIYKWIYIPETSWSSPLESEANQNGGLDYTYNVMDENGNIVQESFSSLDGILSAEGNETLKNLINNIFRNNNNAILRYFNDLWENTKNYRIYNYLILIVSVSIIIYFIKIMKRR